MSSLLLKKLIAPLLKTNPFLWDLLTIVYTVYYCRMVTGFGRCRNATSEAAPSSTSEYLMRYEPYPCIKDYKHKTNNSFFYLKHLNLIYFKLTMHASWAYPR